MYYYKTNGVYCKSSNPISNPTYTQIPESEYQAEQEKRAAEAKEQEKQEKEALLKQLMAELYLAE